MGYRLIHLAKVKSTNSYARNLLLEGFSEENSVVIADYQEGGRGQGENVWFSDSGKNLLFSWIAFPAFLAVSEQFLLSKAVSLAIIDTFKEFNLNANIKWPNDIICNEGKISGILIENSVQGKSIVNSIIGVGINVNQDSFPDFQFPATSLISQTKISHEPMKVFELFSLHLMNYFDQLKGSRSNQIDTLYLENMYRRNEVSDFISEGVRFSGMIEGVSEFGELMINDGGKIRKFGFHSIKMIR